MMVLLSITFFLIFSGVIYADDLSFTKKEWKITKELPSGKIIKKFPEYYADWRTGFPGARYTVKFSLEVNAGPRPEFGIDFDSKAPNKWAPRWSNSLASPVSTTGNGKLLYHGAFYILAGDKPLKWRFMVRGPKAAKSSFILRNIVIEPDTKVKTMQEFVELKKKKHQKELKRINEILKGKVVK